MFMRQKSWRCFPWKRQVANLLRMKRTLKKALEWHMQTLYVDDVYNLHQQDLYLNSFFDDLSRKRWPTKMHASNEETLEATFFGQRRFCQPSLFVRSFWRSASQAHEHKHDLLNFQHATNLTHTVDYELKQFNGKKVIVTAVRRFTTCPWHDNSNQRKDDPKCLLRNGHEHL